MMSYSSRNKYANCAVLSLKIAEEIGLCPNFVSLLYFEIQVGFEIYWINIFIEKLFNSVQEGIDECKNNWVWILWIDNKEP